MIFNKDDASTSVEKTENLTRGFNIHYRYFIGSLIYLLYTRVYLSFSVCTLANFPSNPVKVHFEGLVKFLRYIRDNKALGLKAYYDMNDAHLYDLSIKASIKNENQFTTFSYWQKYRSIYNNLSKWANWSWHACSSTNCSINWGNWLQWSIHYRICFSTF